ncbi:hypothetical protein OESDEN_20478, partial [Oesophagostomum dentatum]
MAEYSDRVFSSNTGKCTQITEREKESGENALAMNADASYARCPNAEECSSDSIFCIDGVATAMKCPDKLVFKKKESCSISIPKNAKPSASQSGFIQRLLKIRYVGLVFFIQKVLCKLR